MSKQIMIVDDSEGVAAALAMAIESRLGVRTVVALHPQTALKLLESEGQISMLVTDLSLPFLDGFELIGAVRRMPCYQWLPAVMITAEEDARRLQTSDDRRPNVILRKPFSITEVCSAVQSLLA
jgi:CheY-like chemotaxis protein